MDQIDCLPDDETAPFWEAAKRSVLLIKRCLDTGRCFHYPRDSSPFTGGKTEWVEASGAGVIYSCSVNYRSDPPDCIAYVQLAEGPIILSKIEAPDLRQVEIGQKVRVAFRVLDEDRRYPIFEVDKPGAS